MCFSERVVCQYRLGKEKEKRENEGHRARSLSPNQPPSHTHTSFIVLCASEETRPLGRPLILLTPFPQNKQQNGGALLCHTNNWAHKEENGNKTFSHKQRRPHQLNQSLAVASVEICHYVGYMQNVHRSRGKGAP